MGPESRFKVKVLKALRHLSPSWWVKVSQVSLVGTPDILGCYGGRFHAFELKKDDKAKATPLQERNISLIAEAGGFSRVVSPEAWDETLSEMKEGLEAWKGRNG